MTQEDTLKGSTFTIERQDSKTPGTVILRLCGPLTARTIYGALPPDALRSLFDSHPAPGGAPHTLNILDFTAVPYLDSMGMGMLVREYVRCQSRGIRLVVASPGLRVLELLALTKLDTVIPLAASVEEAEAAVAA